jgi:hypothetical protein
LRLASPGKISRGVGRGPRTGEGGGAEGPEVGDGLDPAATAAAAVARLLATLEHTPAAASLGGRTGGPGLAGAGRAGVSIQEVMAGDLHCRGGCGIDAELSAGGDPACSLREIVCRFVGDSSPPQSPRTSDSPCTLPLLSETPSPTLPVKLPAWERSEGGLL